MRKRKKKKKKKKKKKGVRDLKLEGKFFLRMERREKAIVENIAILAALVVSSLLIVATFS